jgi:small subunit ribosomal protein S6
MRRYETLFIVTPDSSEEDLLAVATKFRDVVTEMNGLVASYNEQGKKKLAYDVQKQNKGYYVLMDYVGSADLVAEIERNMRLDDRILKYLTLKLADEVDPESIEPEEFRPQKKIESAEAVEPEEAQPEEQPESAEAVEPEEAQPEEQPESAEAVEPEEAQPEEQPESAEVVEPEDAQPEEQLESAEVVEPEEAQPEEQPESAEVVEPKEAQSPEAQDSEKEKA